MEEKKRVRDGDNIAEQPAGGRREEGGGREADGLNLSEFRGSTHFPGAHLGEWMVRVSEQILVVR